MPRLVLCLACLTLLACGPAPLSLRERAVIQQGVRARLDDWAKAVNNKNPDGLASFYHHGPDLTVAWSDGRRTRGWEEEDAVQRDFLGKTSQITFTVIDPVIDPVARGVAIANYGVSVDMDQDGVRSVSAGQGTSVWAKDPTDQVWRIRALHTGRKEVAPPPTRRK
ncbi:MAG: nuclear transport factor 2 family protein [Gemmatimonadetes bacterium]|nr:nuclear transport factor 2 family protein [Gemmatimonadota bacterium]